MFDRKEILAAARRQLALDYNCAPGDFEKSENTVTESVAPDGGRKYPDSRFFKAVCFGGRAVISASAELLPWCWENLGQRESAWLFEMPKLRIIDRELARYGHEIAGVHLYYLPQPAQECKMGSLSVKWYEEKDLFAFRGDDRFCEALGFHEESPDMLAVAAFDGGEILGMAGASADSEVLWQIGINVLPGFHGRGIGTALVSLLQKELLRRGKVPFYGTAVSHILSQNVAANAGFFPAWAELYSKPSAEK